MFKLFRLSLLAMTLCLAFLCSTFAFAQSNGGYTHTGSLTSTYGHVYRAAHHRRHVRHHHHHHHGGAGIHIRL